MYVITPKHSQSNFRFDRSLPWIIYSNKVLAQVLVKKCFKIVTSITDPIVKLSFWHSAGLEKKLKLKNWIWSTFGRIFPNLIKNCMLMEFIIPISRLLVDFFNIIFFVCFKLTYILTKVPSRKNIVKFMARTRRLKNNLKLLQTYVHPVFMFATWNLTGR